MASDEIVKGIALLERSIERDPNYAPAYLELSFANWELTNTNHRPHREGISKTNSAAMKALALDEHLAEAHTILGLIQGTYKWDWAGEERELRRGIELDPNSSFAHIAYAFHLVMLGQKTDALRETQTALELDPFSPAAHSYASFIFLYARQYDLAVREGHRGLEIDPGFGGAHLALANALAAQGALSEGFAEWLRYLSLDGDAELARQLQSAAGRISGLGDPGQRLANIIIGYYKGKSKRQYVAALTMALAYMDLGDKDKTFEWLDKAYQEHSTGLFSICVAPAFDPLRSDPRFAHLLRRMNLPVQPD